MMPNDSGPLSLCEHLPWSAPADWLAANESLSYLVKRHANRLECAQSHAKSILSAFESLFIPMDALCRETCPWCPEPCCLSAKVWIGFQDLVFLYLTGYGGPERQLLGSYSDTCRYLSPKGCTLERQRRPWVCTWYLCPTQKAALRRVGGTGLLRFERLFGIIKTARLRMEDAFIRAIC